MPRVVGMRGFDAKNALEALGLVVNTVRVEAGNPKKTGFVIDQDPRSQSLVVQGDTVTIFIGAAKGGGADGGGNGDGGGGGGGGGGG